MPGPSLDELRAELGLGEVAKLNWNEGLFGRFPAWRRRWRTASTTSGSTPSTPTSSCGRRSPRRSGRADQILPGHGIQTLILALTSAFVSPGDRVVIPRPTYGLYAQASRPPAPGGARALPEMRLDLERIADAARRSAARLVWICDPNDPTGSLIGPDDWATFLDALPPDCVVAADEAYIDYVDPAERLRREDDVAAGRPVIVLRTFSRSSGSPACGWATPWPGRSWCPTCSRCRSPSTSTGPRSSRGWPASGARWRWRSAVKPPSPPATAWRGSLAAAGMEPLPSAGTSCSYTTAPTTRR